MAKQRMEDWFHIKVDKLNDSLAEAMEELAEEGQELLQGYIETRGTGKAWKRTYYKKGIPRGASRPGRVWTGEMRDAIKKDNLRSKDVFIASFGWLDGAKDYYKAQEVGFDHNITGDHIEGMFIMQDAADQMKELFRKRVKGVLSEF